MTEKEYVRSWKVVVLGTVALLLLGILIFGASSGCRSYTRYQRRADAHNAVKVTHIRIQQAGQQAKINRAQIAATRAEAEKRFQESVGIRRAQDEISKTLTPLYVQHEAIQAQRQLVKSQNHTQVYIPSGANGIPLVRNVK